MSKGKWLALNVVIIAVLFALLQVFPEPWKNSILSSGSASQQTSQNSTDSGSEDEDPESDSSPSDQTNAYSTDFYDIDPGELTLSSFWSGFTDQMEETYLEIQTGLENFETEIPVTTAISAADFEKVINVLKQSNPFLFQQDFTTNSQYTLSSSSTVTSYLPSYNMTIEEYEDKKAQMDAIAQEIIASAASNDPYDIELAANAWLVDSVRYDTSAPNSHEVYGALLDKRAVCDGYSRALMYVMQSAGIPCYMITGTAQSDEDTEAQPHGWNAVLMNDGWYYTDVTWNDPVGQEAGIARTLYFNLTCDQMSLDHDDSQNLETAGEYAKENNTENSYYLREGLLCSSLEDYKEILKNAAAQKSDQVVSVKFENESDYQSACKDLSSILSSVLENSEDLSWTETKSLQKDSLNVISLLMVFK